MTVDFRKELGAYYTDQLVAEFLVSWAIRSPEDNVLDPSCGDGVFLNAAAKQLQFTANKPTSTIFGIDIQPQVVDYVSKASIPLDKLIINDFFDVEPKELPRIDTVVGNPPFIRYQRFNGSSRTKALKICRQMGVDLPKLSSSWAPFLIHATRFLKPRGRLAMIVPAEINHASYAMPVTRYFLSCFHSIKIIAFRKRLFPELNQDTFCLLADGYGEACRSFSFLISDGSQSLKMIDLSKGKEVDINSLREGKLRLLDYLLSDETRSLYSDLVQHSNVQSLSYLGNVSVGYVTGANEFFHLSTTEARYYDIPAALLKPAIRSGRQLKGLKFTHAEWNAAEKANEKVWLLLIPPGYGKLPKGVQEYLEMGVLKKVPQAYKCKTRQPWYSVPHVNVGDAFLTYMTGTTPKLVVNYIKAVATNTLHVVNIYPLANISPELLAACWHTSFTMMSCEIEGHALGGGMLKLEPSEAARVSISLPKHTITKKEINYLDNLLKNEQYETALDYADQFILMQGLGLTRKDCLMLREGCEQLKMWRMR